MQRYAKIGVFLLCGALGPGVAADEAADAAAAGETEPAQRMLATVDGQQVEVVAGEPTRVQVNGEWIELLIEPTGERTFSNGNVSFTYRDEMAFLFDNNEPSLRQWYFDGQDCVIIVQEPSAEIAFADYKAELIDIMQQGYGPMFEKREPVTMTLGGEELSGERITASLKDIGVIITQHILFKEHGDTGSVLILQDALTEDAEHSAEFIDLVDRLERTLRWGPPEASD